MQDIVKFCPEVLAPAGDYERLTAALDYGADAVYLGGQAFGMRASPQNFSFDELISAVKLAHSRNARVFLTCNTLPRNSEIAGFQAFIEQAVAANVDAVIATDIGILSLIKKYAPNMEIHISTQAGIVNYVTADEFYNMGAKRVVLARELSLEEISEIRAKTPKILDIEVFVHGAMCVSFSGRCLLSSYMVNRDANRGECAQPCRWGFHLMEEKRPNEFFPIYEDEKGSYILNAKDLCMIDFVKELTDAGVSSLKIEGRAKSAYYVAVVTNAYRMAVDAYKQGKELPQWARDEVYKISHRNYCTGFFHGHPKDCQYYENSGYIREYDVAAIVDECRDGFIYATQRNKFSVGDSVEILSPNCEPIALDVAQLINEAGDSVISVPHSMEKFSMRCSSNYPKNSIIRKKL